MILQDPHGLPALLQRGALAAARLGEVHEQRQRLLVRGHQVDGALHHEDQVLDLPVALLRVLPVRVEVVAGPAAVVVAQDPLLARFVLDRDVLRRELSVVSVLAPPAQRRLQPLRGLRHVPGRGAEVAQEAFVR